MPTTPNSAERAIASELLAHWDPLRVRDLPGAHDEYLTHAHTVYGLLARGASSTQIGRYLHGVESGEMHHPELASADLSPRSGRLISTADGFIRVIGEAALKPRCTKVTQPPHEECW